jgi:hypothetical protein
MSRQDIRAEASSSSSSALSDFEAGEIEQEDIIPPSRDAFQFFQGRTPKRSADAFKEYFTDIKASKKDYADKALKARKHNQDMKEYKAYEDALKAWHGHKNYQKVRNPYLGYNLEAIKDLADVVGKHNVGIKFNPTFNSKAAAEEWLEAQLDRAARRGDKNAVDKLRRWRIDLEDMDRDEGTVPNVVVYDDYDNKRIKAIDGYMIAPRNKKEALRAEYDLYPTRELRQANMKEDKKRLKQYFRKYPNPALWGTHKFSEFEVKESLFNRLRDKYIKENLNLAGFTINRKDRRGNLTVAHYMTIIQKIMSRVMDIAYLVVFPALPPKYPFKEDRLKVKTKRNKEQLEKELTNPITDKQIERLKILYPNVRMLNNVKTGTSLLLEQLICLLVQYIFIVSNGEEDMRLRNNKLVPNSDIFKIVKEINRKSGKIELEITGKKAVTDFISRYTMTDYNLPRYMPKTKLPTIYDPENIVPLSKNPNRWTTVPENMSMYDPTEMFGAEIGNDIDIEGMVKSLSGDTLADYMAGKKRPREDFDVSASEEEEESVQSESGQTRKKRRASGADTSKSKKKTITKLADLQKK